MTITAQSLRELHRIHRQLTDLRERLRRGPQQIRAAEATVQRAESELEQAKTMLRQARMASDEKQLQLKQREDRLAELKIKLNTCGSNREFQALKEQIAADLQANSVLSDEIIEMLDKIDQLQASVGDRQQGLHKAREDAEKIKQRVSAQQGGLEEELARLTAQLHQAEAKLPPDFKSDYDRVVRARGEDALAPVEGESCGHCFRTLTPQTLNELGIGRPVFCKSCGCLLYLPEDRSP